MYAGDKWGYLEGECSRCGNVDKLHRLKRLENEHHVYTKYCLDCQYKYVYKSLSRRKKPQKESKEKRRAYAAVAWALKTKKIHRPDSCKECGGTERRIEASHHDYSKPLDIRWLCAPCHRAIDNYRRQMAL